MIKNICEILVDFGFIESLPKAKNAVKKGRVTVEGMRVANTDGTLVLVHPVMICLDDTCARVNVK